MKYILSHDAKSIYIVLVILGYNNTGNLNNLSDIKVEYARLRIISTNRHCLNRKVKSTL